MKIDMDKIVFENRREIEEVMIALENSTDKDKETVQELINLLDAMYMFW